MVNIFCQSQVLLLQVQKLFMQVDLTTFMQVRFKTFMQFQKTFMRVQK